MTTNDTQDATAELAHAVADIAAALAYANPPIGSPVALSAAYGTAMRIATERRADDADVRQRLDLAERRLAAIMEALERELPNHFTRLDFDVAPREGTAP